MRSRRTVRKRPSVVVAAASALGYAVLPACADNKADTSTTDVSPWAVGGASINPAGGSGNGGEAQSGGESSGAGQPMMTGVGGVIGAGGTGFGVSAGGAIESSGGANGLGGISGATGGTSAAGSSNIAGQAASCWSTCKADDFAKPSQALFVSEMWGNDADGGGGPEAPLKTLKMALSIANFNSMYSAIYLDEGNYPQAITIAPAQYGTFQLLGGWKFDGTTWVRDCDPGARSRTIVGTDSAAPLTLQDHSLRSCIGTLTIKTKTQGATVAGQPGESLIGVVANDYYRSAQFNDVDIVVGRAGDGGTVAQPSAAGNVDCNGLSCPGTEGPGPGVDGLAAAAAGLYGPAGFRPSNGAPGEPGGDGSNGTPGAPGGEALCVASCVGQCTVEPFTCASGGSTFLAGSGAGLCGCGGLGGPGGIGGLGGGAAIGVFVAHSVITGTLTFINSTISVRGGGNGADGSLGGLGGSGTAGKSGANVANCPSACEAQSSVTTCECQLNAGVIPGGTAGGPGAAGGVGGRGGGGAGGDAFAFVIAETFFAPNEASIAAYVGPAGTGASGAVDGRSGFKFTF